MGFSYIHSFARQVLHEQGFQIFSDSDEVLSYRGKIYDIPKLKTRIQVGSEEFKPSEKIMRVYNVQKLADIGFKIISIPYMGWFKGQKNRYELVKISSIKAGLKDMPPEHFVEFDLVNSVARIIGKNANWNKVGQWIHLHTLQKKERNKNPVTSYLEDRRKLLGMQEDKKYIDIPEIPIMIDEQGWIICMEEQTNEPCVGIVGQRRMGNSFLMHGMGDRAYHKWHKLCCFLNDGLDETDTYCMPWKQHPSQPNTFVREIERLGEYSVPMPCVYFTPHHFGVIDEDVFYPKEVGFRTSLSFKDMALDYENFLKGNEKWIFKNSMTYFKTLLFNEDDTLNDNFINAESFREWDLIMKEKWFNEYDQLDKTKVAEGTFMKIFNTLKDIWNQQILNNTNKIPSKWKVKMPSGEVFEDVDPLVACLMCNLIPILRTRKIKNQPWFPQEFKYRLEQIFKAQVENPYFKRNKLQVWVFIDEILSIAATDNKTVAAEAIDKIVRESGPARIGFVYRAQNYNKVLNELRNNTGYVFAFKQYEESAKAILKNFGMPTRKGYVEELTSLKRYQLMAFTNHKFIAYNPMTGERKEIADRPVRGTVIPPLSWHKPPKETGK